MMQYVTYFQQISYLALALVAAAANTPQLYNVALPRKTQPIGTQSGPAPSAAALTLYPK